MKRLLSPRNLTPSERRWERGKIWSSVIGITFGVIALCLSDWGFSEPFDPRSLSKKVQLCVLAGWVLIPPIWLWYESFFISNRIEEERRPGLDIFKHGQDQCAKVWLALVTVPFGFYFGKDLGGEHAGPAGSPCVSQPAASTVAAGVR